MRALARQWLAVAMLALAGVAAAAQLRPFDAGSMKAIAASHAGRPYVLAFWSVHCAPCIEDMDDWRELQRRHPGLPVILVTTDPRSEHAQVSRILAKYRMDKVENWAFADEFAERVRFAVDPGWRGELPRTYFFDAAHLAEVRSGRIDRRRAEAWFARQRPARAK
jgi:hypothetical protein